MTAQPGTDAGKIALLNLLSVEGIGSATVLRLVEHFGTVRDVFEASESRLQTIPRVARDIAIRLKAIRADGEIGRTQFQKAKDGGIEILTCWEENFPRLLLHLESDMPVVLFFRGKLPAEANRLAVVGTRSATAYGKRVARDLILGLRGSGIHVVSGLASGIDGTAHEAALEVELPTEAVFGCGVDHIYPAMNTALANRIVAAGGALLSEYPPGTTPERHHFPQRNRIIAGLSKATLVVEAGDRSGALITALLAAEYNREVMAVPGAITNPKAAGCHELIKNGAALIEKSEDILNLLNGLVRPDEAKPKQAQIVFEGPEALLVKILDATEAQHIDLIAQKTKLHVGEALGQLLLLELKGAVKQLPGKYFVRT